MNSVEVISIYEHVATITDQMVVAAEHADWELLAQLEVSCSREVAALKSAEIPAKLDKEIRERKIKVINKILADDRKIRDITEPRMAQLTQLMQKSSTQHKLARAYELDHRRPG